jgi:HTH-type transcriptional regulator/antitoxin HipB
MAELLQFGTPADAQRLVANRAREIRLALGLKQATLAERAGVTLPTLRRFEQTGEVSIKHLMRICHALGRLDDFASFMIPPPAMTMAELESRAAKPRRKRGSL